MADFSRQRVSTAVLDCLVKMADELDLRGRIRAMYEGGIANPTDSRQVLHTALRRSDAPHADLVVPERRRVLDFAEAVRSGKVVGSSGEPFDLVVNIGIGGSDLGPAMAVEALRHFSAGAPRVVFASNIDGCRLADLLKGANPRRTLFIVCSKTFTTLETLTNAGTAKRWLASGVWVSVGAAAFRGGFGQRTGHGRLRHPPGLPVRHVGLGWRGRHSSGPRWVSRLPLPSVRRVSGISSPVAPPWTSISSPPPGSRTCPR
ncbi:MAG: hypothetical protein IPH71_01660 [Proteobacteria bacterium]|nr:hypothetical protein [Pseudomonadota bacterium]